jgi:hypothetical protein
MRDIEVLDFSKEILTRRRGIELNRRRGGILICVPADLLLVDSIEVIA